MPALALDSEKLREKEIETKTANNNAKLRAKSDGRKWDARGGDGRDGNEAPRRAAALSICAHASPIIRTGRARAHEEVPIREDNPAPRA